MNTSEIIYLIHLINSNQQQGQWPCNLFAYRRNVHWHTQTNNNDAKYLNFEKF